MKKFLLILGCLGLLMFGTVGVSGAINFDIGSNNSPESGTGSSPTGNYWQLGTGWGTSSGQLDADFNISNSLPGIAFTLNNVGDHSTFKFGDITLNEYFIGNGSNGDYDETNNLQVTGWLHFDLPAGLSLVGNPGDAVAVPGYVYDSGTDLTISFAPVTVNFGTGKFTVDLSDISFNSQYQCKEVDATVTLTSVPEPASLLFLGFGLVGLAATRIRKKH